LPRERGIKRLYYVQFAKSHTHGRALERSIVRNGLSTADCDIAMHGEVKTRAGIRLQSTERRLRAKACEKGKRKSR